MNLNKYTKAELISKFKRLENKNSKNNYNQTFSQWIINNLVLIKNLLFKLTIISLLIKTFRKYSIFRRIWVILNTIVMSIFGISILDFYGISFLVSFYTELTSIVGNVINYLTNTHFYETLAGLFSNKVEKVENPSKFQFNLNERTSNETNGVSKNSKINDWFNRPEEINKEPESNNNKYYIIAGLLIFYLIEEPEFNNKKYYIILLYIFL